MRITKTKDHSQLSIYNNRSCQIIINKNNQKLRQLPKKSLILKDNYNKTPTKWSRLSHKYNSHTTKLIKNKNKIKKSYKKSIKCQSRMSGSNCLKIINNSNKLMIVNYKTVN